MPLEGKKGWLWTLVSESVIVFEVALSWSSAIAKSLTGKDYSGIVISDRYSGYSWVEESHRQLCLSPHQYGGGLRQNYKKRSPC